jgi:hypothetical protein
MGKKKPSRVHFELILLFRCIAFSFLNRYGIHKSQFDESWLSAGFIETHRTAAWNQVF